MEVVCITATKNRHSHLEKLVRCFLEQDYQGNHTLIIYNNAEETQELDKSLLNLPANKKIILLNINRNISTGEPYQTLGEIYNDCIYTISCMKEDGIINPQLVNHTDDDDFFFSNHITEGVKGYLEGGLKAYKPKFSYYKDSKGISKASNVLEPSIFVEFNHVLEHGYFTTNADSHHKWLQPLIKEEQLYVKEKGVPTFVYDWSGQIPTWKTSGDPYNPNNFQNYAKFSKDIGDQVVTPAPKSILQNFKI